MHDFASNNLAVVCSKSDKQLFMRNFPYLSDQPPKEVGNKYCSNMNSNSLLVR